MWTCKLAPIFAYGKWLYPYRMLLHGASDLDQRCLKMRRSVVVAFIGGLPPNIFAPTPKIPSKPRFGGPFNAKPIIERVLRKSHVNGAAKLKLYSYIGIDKYLSVCQNFPLGGVWGCTGPPNVHLGLPNISETTRARKLNFKKTIRYGKVPALGTKMFFR